jgi:hypothetical protein
MRLNCILKNALVHFHITCYPSSPYSRTSSLALATNHTLSNRLQLCVPFVGLVNCSSKVFFTDLRVFTTSYRGVLSSSVIFTDLRFSRLPIAAFCLRVWSLLICGFHDFLYRRSDFECVLYWSAVFTTFYIGVLTSSVIFTDLRFSRLPIAAFWLRVFFMMTFFITKANPKPIYIP